MKLFTTIIALAAIFSSALAGPLPNQEHEDDDHHHEHGLHPICRPLATQDNGCVRYTKGFDVTGVVTQVDLIFPEVKNECDCIQECLNRPSTCANYVWKFSTPASVINGHRTCTLYSDFNLPAAVRVVIDLNNPMNVNINAAEIVVNGNNPHQGGLVPQAFKDVNLNTVVDKDAVSGPVWQLANGKVQC